MQQPDKIEKHTNENNNINDVGELQLNYEETHVINNAKLF